MASEFDVIRQRRRERGAAAKARVMNRLNSPQSNDTGAGKSEFDAIRNRSTQTQIQEQPHNKPQETNKGIKTLKPADFNKISNEIRMAPLKYINSLSDKNDTKLETPEEREIANQIRMAPLRFTQGLEQQVDARKAEEKSEYQRQYEQMPKYRQVAADIVNSPIGKLVFKANDASSDFIRGALDTASLGAIRPLDEAIASSPLLNQREQERMQGEIERSRESTAGKVGEFAGYLVPGAAADRLAFSLGKTAIQGLPKIAQGAIRGTVAGAVDSAAQEAGDVAFREGKFDPLNVAIGAGAGGLLGGAAGGIGELVSKNTRDLQRQLGGVAGAIDAAMRKEYPARLTSPGALKQLDEAMTKIKPIVTERMTPPLENPNELAKWVQKHAGIEGISLNEIRELPYEGLRELAEDIRPKLNTATEAYKAAQELGYDLPALLNGQGRSIVQRASQDATRRAYGIYPDSLPNVRRNLTESEFGAVRSRNKTPNAPESGVTGAVTVQEGMASQGARGATQAQRAPEAHIAPATASVNSIQHEMERVADNSPVTQSLTRPEVDSITLAQGVAKKESEASEAAFAQRIRTSQKTPDELVQALERDKLNAPTTTHANMIQRAQEMLSRHGEDGVYKRIMDKERLSDAENTAAQALIRKYASTGDSGDLQKAIDLTTRVAASGREMGQAINSLKLWDKLDAEGVLLQAERIINRGRESREMVKLTGEQAKPLIEATKKIQTVDRVNNLAREVALLLAHKARGEVFTTEEKALLTEFQRAAMEAQKEVRPLVQEVKKQRQTKIKEVSSIEPKKRTRDQVVEYLDAVADNAREELKRQKYMGFAARANKNPVIEYTKIGAAIVARGVVKFADWAEEMIKEGITDKLGEIYVKAVNRFRKESGLPTGAEINRVVNRALKKNEVDEETANAIRAMGAEIGFYPDAVKRELTQDLQVTLQNLGKSTFGDKLGTLQRSAMLLNPVTYGKNFIGNLAEMSAQKLSNVAMLPVDWTRSKLTGRERTIRFITNNPEKFWRNYIIGTKSGWRGVSPSGTMASEYVRPPSFKGKYNPLTYVEKTLRASLTGADHAFARKAYGEALGTFVTNIGKAKGMTNAEIRKNFDALADQLDNNIFKIAEDAAKFATFTNKTLLGWATSTIQRGLNEMTGNPRFGVGNLVIPFAKVPAAIIVRAFDYSPLGVLRAAYQLMPWIEHGSQVAKVRAFQQALGRAIVGSLGYTGLGMWLGHNGILTGRSPYDPKKTGLEEAEGRTGGYKLNWDALRRFIVSGFDQDAAKWQDGDTLIGYNWFQPASIVIAAGVDAAKALDEGRDSNAGTIQRTLNALTAAGKTGLDAFLESPYIGGIKDVAKIASGEANGIDVIVDSLMTFVPSMANRYRQESDNQRRETLATNKIDQYINKLKNRLPGQSKELPQSYGTFGQPRQYMSGSPDATKRFLNAFFNPAPTTKYSPTKVTTIVSEIYEKSKDAGVLPKKAQKTINVPQEGAPSKKVQLNGQQYSTYQKDLGELTSKLIEQYSDYFTDPQTPLSDKVAAMKKIISVADEEAKNTLILEILGYK